MKKSKQIGLAIFALVAVAIPLYAEVIWSGERNIDLSWSSDSSPSWPPPPIPIALEMDLNEDGINDFTIGETDPLHSSWFYAVSEDSNKHTGDWIGEAGGIIDNSRSDWTGGEHLLVSWMILLNEQEMGGVGAWLGQTGYMGLQFDADGETHFGWVRMTAYDEFPGMTIHGWAYESIPGVGIVAGAVPEPSSSLLVVIGAMSVWVLRRRNRSFKPWGE